MKLLFGLEADRDLEDAAVWYERREPGLGERFLVDVDYLLSQIQSGPQRFPVIGLDVRRGLTKRFPYAVYFLVHEESIVVMGILHQHRHPDTWLKRL